MWHCEIDPSVKCAGTLPRVDELTPEGKVRAISCLLLLEGRQGKAKISGVTSWDHSSVLPHAPVEVAALIYIRYLYLGRWDRCNGIALTEPNGDFNEPSAVERVFASYKKWFEKVKEIGLDEAKARGLDPMDDCPDVYWY
jgi:hypothetical protein